MTRVLLSLGCAIEYAMRYAVGCAIGYAMGYAIRPLTMFVEISS